MAAKHHENNGDICIVHKKQALTRQFIYFISTTMLVLDRGGVRVICPSPDGK